MVRITDLSEDYSLDAAALARGGVSSVDDLWACISRNVDQGIARVATETRMSRDVLFAFLITDALYEPKRRSDWLRGRAQRLWGTRGNLWPDLLLLTLPFLILVLGLRGQYLNQSVVQRVAVNSGVTLPAFAAIDINKLTTRAVIDERGSFASVNDLKLRYPLRDLAPGEVLKDEHLVPSGLSGRIAGRRLLSLPIKNSHSAESVQPMDQVRLILAPRDKEISGVAIDDVIFLSRKKEGKTTFVLVAIPENKLTQIEGLLGTCDIFVSQRLSSS